MDWKKLQNGSDIRGVAIEGVDSRISGPMLSDAIIKGICESGADAVRCGLASTPAMFMITIDPERPCSPSQYRI